MQISCFALRSRSESTQMYEFFFKLTPNNAGSILIFRNLLPKFVSAAARKGDVIAFSEYVAYLCDNISTDTESVSLFSTCERRKFTGRENKRNLLHVLSIFVDRRGAVAYLSTKVSYDLQV